MKKNGARKCMAAKQRKMESHTTITILGAHASDNIRRHIIDSYCSILNFDFYFGQISNITIGSLLMIYNIFLTISIGSLNV